MASSMETDEERWRKQWEEKYRKREQWGCEPMDPTPEPEEQLSAGRIYFLYNDDYGGFGWSKRARDELKARGWVDSCSDDARYDPIAVAVFNEKGSQWCSGQYCTMKRTTVPEKYLDYVKISEYDGDERVSVDYDRAFSEGVRKLLDSNTATIDDIRSFVTEMEKDRGRKFYYPRDRTDSDENSDEHDGVVENEAETASEAAEVIDDNVAEHVDGNEDETTKGSCVIA